MSLGSVLCDGVRFPGFGFACESRTFAFGLRGGAAGGVERSFVTAMTTSVIVLLVLMSLNVFLSVDAQSYPLMASVMAPEVRGNNAVFKGFSGYRRRNDTSRLIYWYDQTIAVIEVQARRVLVNCELIEIYRPGEEQLAMDMLKSVGKPHKIDFKKMMKLMRQCHELDVSINDLVKPSKAPKLVQSAPISAVTSERTSSLFSGILPGTLWCGTGDLAQTYFDLGQERYLDKCCRSHDLCPVKVQGSSSKYNITNNSIYTKSHCECDKNLFDCLKKSSNSKADLMGNIYFNILRVQCVDDGQNGKYFKNNLKY